MTLLEKLCQDQPGARLTELAPGYPVLELQHGELTARVSLYGGQLLSCRQGEKDWLWANPSLSIQPGKALRAGVPVCWPWFGTRKNSGENAVASDKPLPSHGFVRTLFWCVDALHVGNESLTLSLVCQDDENSRNIWPHRFELRLTICLTDKLSVDLDIHNCGQIDYPISGALHSYFAVTDIEQTAIEGFTGSPYYDQLSGHDSRQHGDIDFANETDRIYRTGPNTATIKIANAPTLLLRQFGNTDTVVWTPWQKKAARLGDISEDSWRQFVCVETAIANENAIVLPAGTRYRLGFQLQSAPELASITP